MQAVKKFVLECVRVLWMAGFRPKSFRQEVERFNHRQVRRFLTETFLVGLLTALTIILISHALLESAGRSFALLWSLGGLTVAVAGVLILLVTKLRKGGNAEDGKGYIVNLKVSVRGGVGEVADGLASGVAVGVWCGVMGGLRAEDTLGVAGGAAFGMVFGAVISEGVVHVVNDLFGASEGLAERVKVGLGVALGIGLLVSLLESSAVGAAAGLGAIIGYFRLALVPIESLTTGLALFRTKRERMPAGKFLRQSLAYWDEVMLVPQPFLTSLLVLLGKKDRNELLNAATHLATNTFQRKAAANALLKVISLDLLQCRGLEEIVRVHQGISWMTPNPVLSIAAWGVRLVLESEIIDEIAFALSSTSKYQKQLALNRARRQLNDLRKSAEIGSRGPQSRFVAQVAQQWLEAVNTEIDRLTEEGRAAERIPNPYVAPRPLLPDSQVFVGRTEVFRFIEGHFLRPDQNVPIVLHGQPRIGKSSLLRHLATTLPTNLISVYVDMQRAAQVESTGGLLLNLADAIARALTSRGVALQIPSLNALMAEPFIVFAKFLDAVEETIRAPENRLILALDEFEEIERKLTEGKISLDLMPFLRNMMQHREGIALIFAGTHTLDDMIQEYWAPYFRSAVPFKVTYLNIADARKLITEPIEGFPLNYEPQAVDLLVELTNCHPCLIQLTCMELVDLKNEQRSRHASVEDVEQAMAKVLETGDYVFRGIWDWIPVHERGLLSVLSTGSLVTIEELTRSLRLPQAEVRRMTQRLAEAEVITRSNERDDHQAFRFQADLFRQWVERHAARAGTVVEELVSRHR